LYAGLDLLFLEDDIVDVYVAGEGALAQGISFSDGEGEQLSRRLGGYDDLIGFEYARGVCIGPVVMAGYCHEGEEEEGDE